MLLLVAGVLRYLLGAGGQERVEQQRLGRQIGVPGQPVQRKIVMQSSGIWLMLHRGHMS